MTVDKQSLVEDVQRLGNPVARTIIPKGSIGGYASPEGLRCISDAQTEVEKQQIIAEARQLLRDAGYNSPSDVPTIEILFNKDGGHDLIAQVVQKNWQEYLGVSVRLAQKEIKVFRDDLKQQRYMQLIDGYEPVGRGFYAGAVGYFAKPINGGSASADKAICIRTLVFENDRYTYQAGAGIVADSVPEAEYQEVRSKVAVLENALELAEGGW